MLKFCPLGRQEEYEAQPKGVAFHPADRCALDFERALPREVKQRDKLQSLCDVDVGFSAASASGNVGDVRFSFDFI